jgi:hypothetical protein
LNDVELIRAAAELSHRAPQEWEKFLTSFAAYVEARREECIASPPDTFLINQGRARACAALRKLFAECSVEARKIEAKQAQRSQAR